MLFMCALNHALERFDQISSKSLQVHVASESGVFFGTCKPTLNQLYCLVFIFFCVFVYSNM